MKRISMLNEQVYTRIAAGEVVANPAAVVKELCENSIDAASTAITVEIKEGGKKYIRVSDNGSGIHKEDILLTIEKHATSKISLLEDLDNISTMGFRGEALFSISAVSNLTISSRTNDSNEGCVLKVVDNQKNVAYAGLPEGTTITVENLFYNVPARLKFLSNTTRETVGVSNIMAKLILANPDIAFKYINNDKIIYQSPGNNKAIDALMSIYDSNIKNKVKEVNYSKDDILITGYVSAPDFLYRSTANISVFVNNRYIKSKSIQEQIIHSYGERLLKGHFPLAVISIQIPYDLADVNVHPNKLEIMFKDETYILHCVDIGIRRALDNLNTPMLTISEATPTLQPQIETQAMDAHNAYDNTIDGKNTNENSGYNTITNITIKKEQLQMPDLRSAERLYEKQTTLKQTGFSVHKTNSEYLPKDAENTTGLINAKDIFDIEDFKKIGQSIAQQEQQSLPLREVANYKLIGQIFETYIIIESNNSIYFIDQHAAHERIIFEQLKKERVIQSQPLLISHIMKLNAKDFELIVAKTTDLSEIGFSIEEFGALTIKINAIPLAVGEERGVEKLIEDVLFELREVKGSKDIIIMKEKLIRSACKHSIKAGMPLSSEQIKSIIEEITAKNVIPNCPHGRPIAVCITKEELEKGFKRIV